MSSFKIKCTINSFNVIHNVIFEMIQFCQSVLLTFSLSSTKMKTKIAAKVQAAE